MGRSIARLSPPLGPPLMTDISYSSSSSNESMGGIMIIEGKESGKSYKLLLFLLLGELEIFGKWLGNGGTLALQRIHQLLTLLLRQLPARDVVDIEILQQSWQCLLGL